MHCSNLISIDIPSNVKDIEITAFYECNSLSEVTLPSSITKINSSVFQGCTSLKSITIPEAVTKIESYAFYDCNNLASITSLPLTPPALDIYAFENTNDCPIYVPAESINSYKVARGWGEYIPRLKIIPD